MVVRGCYLCYLYLNLFKLLYYFTHITAAEIRNSCCCCCCCYLCYCYFSFVCLIMFTKHTVNSRHELNFPWYRWRRRRRWSNIGKLFQKNPSKFCVYFVIMISFFTLLLSLFLALSLEIRQMKNLKYNSSNHHHHRERRRRHCISNTSICITQMTTWRLN